MIRDIARRLLSLALALVPGDHRRAALVRRAAFIGKPHARHSFDHYRSAAGRPLHISTADLLREDSGLRDALIRQIDAAHADQGRVTVSQRYATDRDWRYALGSVRFDFHRTAAGYEVVATSRYGWHPQQARITQAIHRLAVRLQRDGARSFDIEGAPALLSASQLTQARTPRALPVHAYLL